MKQITFYRTKSYGGQYRDELEIKNFETIEFAKADALKNDWNGTYTLFKVIMTFDGVITEDEENLGKIPGGRYR